MCPEPKPFSKQIEDLYKIRKEVFHVDPSWSEFRKSLKLSLPEYLPQKYVEARLKLPYRDLSLDLQETLRRLSGPINEIEKLRRNFVQNSVFLQAQRTKCYDDWLRMNAVASSAIEARKSLLKYMRPLCDNLSPLDPLNMPLRETGEMLREGIEDLSRQADALPANPPVEDVPLDDPRFSRTIDGKSVNIMTLATVLVLVLPDNPEQAALLLRDLAAWTLDILRCLGREQALAGLICIKEIIDILCSSFKYLKEKSDTQDK